MIMIIYNEKNISRTLFFLCPLFVFLLVLQGTSPRPSEWRKRRLVATTSSALESMEGVVKRDLKRKIQTSFKINKRIIYIILYINLYIFNLDNTYHV